MKRSDVVILLSSLAILAAGIAFMIPSLKKTTISSAITTKAAGTSGTDATTYTSKWTVSQWMNAVDAVDSTGGNLARFSLGPAAWKVQTDLGTTRVCETWRLTAFKTSGNSTDNYNFPNDSTELKASAVNNFGSAVKLLIYTYNAINGEPLSANNGSASGRLSANFAAERTNNFYPQVETLPDNPLVWYPSGAYNLTFGQGSLGTGIGIGKAASTIQSASFIPSEWTVTGQVGTNAITCP